MKSVLKGAKMRLVGLVGRGVGAIAITDPTCLTCPTSPLPYWEVVNFAGLGRINKFVVWSASI
jgi:hypothetical protein